MAQGLQDPLFPFGPWPKARTTRVLIAIALYAICPEKFLCNPLIRRVRHQSCLNPKQVAAAPGYALTVTSQFTLRFTRPPLEPRSKHPTTRPVMDVPADLKPFGLLFVPFLRDAPSPHSDTLVHSYHRFTYYCEHSLLLARASDPAQLDVLAAHIHDSRPSSALDHRGTSEEFYASRSSHRSVPLQHLNRARSSAQLPFAWYVFSYFSSPDRGKMGKFLPVVAKHPLLNGL